MGKLGQIARFSVRELILFPLTWAAIFGLTLLAETTTLSTGEMAVWPADAITLAFMLGPMRRRPIIAMIVCRSASQALSTYVNFPLIPGLAINAESLVGISILYFLLVKVDHKKMYSSTNLIKLFCSSAVVCFFTAIVQTMTIASAFKVDVYRVFKSCFCANFIAYIVLVPVCLIIYDHIRQGKLLNSETWKSSIALLIFSIFCYFITASSTPLLFLLPLGLMTLSYVANVGAVACGVLATGVFTVVATVSGRGVIAAASGTPSTHLLLLQFFLAVMTACLLPMASRMSEHKALRESLMDARLEAEAANIAKSQFLATISHEIRTPLNGVLGMAQIMGMGDLEPVQKERLNILRRSGEVLLSILNDVLDLSKIEAGKLVIEVIDFDLGELLRSFMRAYEPLAEAKGLELTCDISSIDGIFRGDPTRLRQILSNLVSNALKFTEFGGISLSARYASETLFISVKDTGIGIAPDQLTRLFTKYAQADATTTRRFGGTGLGLSICRDLATLMGGEIRVESQLGQGSTFIASIPMLRVADAQTEEAQTPLWDEAFGAGVKILAAEDNPTNQLVLRTLLEMVGYEVSIVGDGQEAVAFWEKADWDVILMDVHMPVLDGLGAASAIRAREAAAGRRRTPIIALTANAMAHEVDAYLAVGMDCHVAKPIDAEQLFQALIDAIDQPHDTRAA